MMRASSVAERDGARRRRRRRHGCGASRSASRPASPRRWTGPRPRRCCNERGARWPDAFKRSIGVALKDEEDLAFISAPARRPASRRRRMSDELQLPRAARVFVSFVALLRAQRLCRRAGADDGVPRGDRAARPAQHGCISAAPGIGDAGAAAGAARDLRSAVRHPFPRQRGDRADAGAEATRKWSALQEEGRGEDEPLLGRRSQRVRAAAAARRGAGRRAASRQATTGDALRRSRARPPARLPRRRGHRRMRARRGPWADLRRTLRESMRNDGEVLRLRTAEAPRRGRARSCC